MFYSKNVIKLLINVLTYVVIMTFCTSCAHVNSTQKKIIEIDPLEIPPVEELDILRNHKLKDH